MLTDLGMGTTNMDGQGFLIGCRMNPLADTNCIGTTDLMCAHNLSLTHFRQARLFGWAPSVSSCWFFCKESSCNIIISLSGFQWLDLLDNVFHGTITRVKFGALTYHFFSPTGAVYIMPRCWRY